MIDSVTTPCKSKTIFLIHQSFQLRTGLIFTTGEQDNYTITERFLTYHVSRIRHIVTLKRIFA